MVGHRANMRSPPTSGKKQMLRALKQVQVQPASASLFSMICSAVGALAVVGLLSRALQTDKPPASGSGYATSWLSRPSFLLWLLAFTALWRIFCRLAYPTSQGPRTDPAAAAVAAGIVGHQGTSPARTPLTPLRAESRATPFAQNMAMMSGARRRAVATAAAVGTCSPDATYGNCRHGTGTGTGTGAGSLRRTPQSGGGIDIGDRARARTRGSPFASPPAPMREQDVAAYVKRQSEQTSAIPDSAGNAAAGTAAGTYSYNNFLINPYSAPTVDQSMTHSPSHQLGVGVSVGGSAGFGVAGVGTPGLVSPPDVVYAPGWNGYSGGISGAAMQPAPVGRHHSTADHKHRELLQRLRLTTRLDAGTSALREWLALELREFLLRFHATAERALKPFLKFTPARGQYMQSPPDEFEILPGHPFTNKEEWRRILDVLFLHAEHVEWRPPHQQRYHHTRSQQQQVQGGGMSSAAQREPPALSILRDELRKYTFDVLVDELLVRAQELQYMHAAATTAPAQQAPRGFGFAQPQPQPAAQLQESQRKCQERCNEIAANWAELRRQAAAAEISQPAPLLQRLHVMQRLHELADSKLGDARWDGVARPPHPERPSDADIIMRFFVWLMDDGMARRRSCPCDLPFSRYHFSHEPLDTCSRGQGREREPRNVIFRTRANGMDSNGERATGTHFEVWCGAEDRPHNKVWQVKPGPNNVLHAIVLFLFSCRNNVERANECLVRHVSEVEASSGLLQTKSKAMLQHRQMKEAKSLLDVVFPEETRSAKASSVPVVVS